MISAIPWPTPMHMVHRGVAASGRLQLIRPRWRPTRAAPMPPRDGQRRSLRRSGWTCAGRHQGARARARHPRAACAAKRFRSARSRPSGRASARFFSSTFLVAGAGPTPMMRGATPRPSPCPGRAPLASSLCFFRPPPRRRGSSRRAPSFTTRGVARGDRAFGPHPRPSTFAEPPPATRPGAGGSSRSTTIAGSFFFFPLTEKPERSRRGKKTFRLRRRPARCWLRSAKASWSGAPHLEFMGDVFGGPPASSRCRISISSAG